MWEFKGYALADTSYELRLFGRPDAQALTNLIRQLELYREFVSDAIAEEPEFEP